VASLLLYNIVDWCESEKNILCECETWSLTLTEEHNLRASNNSVLRRIFGSKKNEVTGSWRKLHNEELQNLHCSPNVCMIIKLMRIR
jgi:hypothetical protein